MKNWKRILTATAAMIALSVAAPAVAGECEGDVNDDGMVDVMDILDVLGQWGECGDPCTGDLDGNGLVDVQDLLVVISNLGPCGEPQCDSHEACDDGDDCTLDLCIFGACYNIPIHGCGG